MEYAVTLGRLADRDRERRGERAGRDLDAVPGDDALGLADRRGRAGRVTVHIFDLAAADPALLVDHVAGDLHGLPVLDAVFRERPGQRQQHADLDRLLRPRRSGVNERQRHHGECG
jgi:hypothetical protein